MPGPMPLIRIFASAVGEKCQNVSKFNSVIVGDMFRVRMNRGAKILGRYQVV